MSLRLLAFLAFVVLLVPAAAHAQSATLSVESAPATAPAPMLMPRDMAPAPRRRTGLLIAGAVTFGAAYVPSVVWGMLELGGGTPDALHGGLMLIPGVGPLVSIPFTPASYSFLALVTVPAQALLGAAQIAGIAMLIAGGVQYARDASRPGVAPSRAELQLMRERAHRAAWSLAPAPPPGATAGVSFSLTHF